MLLFFLVIVILFYLLHFSFLFLFLFMLLILVCCLFLIINLFTLRTIVGMLVDGQTKDKQLIKIM